MAIDIRKIQYLSFEGGGGKGAAYLGVLEAFKDKRIQFIVPSKENPDFHVLNTKKIKGIAGASAGAITAALLATGVPVEKIYELLTNSEKIAEFKDLQNELVTTSKGQDKFCIHPTILYQNKRGNTEGIKLDTFRTKRGYDKYHIGSTTVDVAQWLHILPKFNPEEKISMLENFSTTFGLYAGIKIRETLIDIIAQHGYKIMSKNGRGQVTFKELFQKTGVELAIMGTKLEKPGEVLYFSVRTTPNMRVVDAVRISASIPPIFAPVKVYPEAIYTDKSDKFVPYPANSITISYPYLTSVEKEYLIGTWIDGGATNNNPIHAFDKEIDRATLDKVQKKPYLAHPRLSKGNDKMLAFTLEDGTVAANLTVGDYISNVLGALTANTTSLQYNDPKEKKQVIDVPIDLPENYKSFGINRK